MTAVPHIIYRTGRAPKGPRLPRRCTWVDVVARGAWLLIAGYTLMAALTFPLR